MANPTWERVPISSVCLSITDCVNRTAPTVDYPTPYKMIRTTNVGNGWVDTENVKYVSEEVYNRWTRREVPRPGDIVLTREAPLGEVGMVRNQEKIFLGQRLISYRPDPEKLDPNFLLYSFMMPDLQGQVHALGSGATVEHMRVPDAKKLTLLLPPLCIQQKIAGILSAYDDLIENNTRRIQILEEMAQSIYREWFVHFRFPGHEDVRMVESEMGRLPELWVTVQLGSVARVNPSQIVKGKEPEEIEYIDISSVSTGRIDSSTIYSYKDAPGRARRIVKHGDTIWSSVRPNRKSYALIINPAENLIVSTGFAVIRAVLVPFSYLYLAITTDDFANYLTNHATGSAYPAVNQEDFEKAKLLLPDQSTLERFQRIVEPLLSLRHNLLRKNENLRQQRDLLLPRLVSGEVDLTILINKAI